MREQGEVMLHELFRYEESGSGAVRGTPDENRPADAYRKMSVQERTRRRRESGL